MRFYGASHHARNAAPPLDARLRLEFKLTLLIIAN